MRAEIPFKATYVILRAELLCVLACQVVNGTSQDQNYLELSLVTVRPRSTSFQQTLRCATKPH